MKEEIIKLAIQFYWELPFYRRNQIKRFYKDNNWDVTGRWQECIDTAKRMVEDAHSKLKNVE